MRAVLPGGFLHRGFAPSLLDGLWSTRAALRSSRVLSAGEKQHLQDLGMARASALLVRPQFPLEVTFSANELNGAEVRALLPDPTYFS